MKGKSISGRLSLFSLLPQVVDAIKIPVIAAGGIADSRGSAQHLYSALKVFKWEQDFWQVKSVVLRKNIKKIIKAKDIDSLYL